MVMLGWMVWLLLAGQRLREVGRARRNTRALKRQGAHEVAPRHYPLMVLLHLTWFATWAAEMACRGVGWNPGWMAPALVGQGLRLWAQGTLGPRWTTRILILPGEPPVQHGPYRWLRHPNYVGVVLELLAFPMLFGASFTAWTFTLANGLLLRWRIRCEERAWTRSGK